VALRAGAQDSRVRALFALGFPLRMVPDTSFLAGLTKPRLFVHGAHDEFASGEKIEALVATLPPPAACVIVPESDHFFSGHLEEMQAALETWLASRPWAER
jgi:alpha/beta superfamily hydrolase